MADKDVGELVAKISVDASDMSKGMQSLISNFNAFGSVFIDVTDRITGSLTGVESGLKALSSNVKSSMEASTRAVTEMTNTMDSRWQEANNNMQRALKSLTSSNSTAIKQVTRDASEISKSYERAFKAVSASYESAFKEISKESGQLFNRMLPALQESVSKSQGLLESLANRYEQSTALIRRSVNTMGTNVASSLGKVNDASDKMANSISRLAESVRTKTELMDRSYSSSMTHMNNASARFTSAMQRVESAMKSLENGDWLKGLVGRVEQLSAQTQRAVNETAKLRQEYSRLNSSSTAFHTASSSHWSNNINESDTFLGKLRLMSLDFYILQYNVQWFGQILTTTFGQGLQFAAEMETSLIGMAGIISSSMTMNGADIKFSDAMSIAKGSIDELKTAALQSTASLEELTQTFQAVLAPGVALGMSMKEIKDFTIFGVNAVKSLGLRKDQLVQELRSIVTGNITARSSTVATALGITNADIENAKTQAGGVYEFLRQRMQGFAQASKETEGTFMALWTNIQDGIQQTQEKAYSGLFDKIKSELKNVQDLFFTIKRYENDEYDDEGKKTHSKGDVQSSTLNENTVLLFSKISLQAQLVFNDIKNWATALLSNETLMINIHNIFETISRLTSSIYANIGTIAELFTVWWATSGGILRLIVSIATYMGELPAILQFISDHLSTIIGLYAAWNILHTPIAGALLNISGILLSQIPIFARIFTSVGAITGGVKVLNSTVAVETAASTGVAAASFVGLRDTALKGWSAIKAGMLSLKWEILLAFDAITGAFVALKTTGAAAMLSLAGSILSLLAPIAAVAGAVYALLQLIDRAQTEQTRLRNEQTQKKINEEMKGNGGTIASTWSPGKLNLGAPQEEDNPYAGDWDRFAGFGAVAESDERQNADIHDSFVQKEKDRKLLEQAQLTPKFETPDNPDKGAAKAEKEAERLAEAQKKLADTAIEMGRKLRESDLNNELKTINKEYEDGTISIEDYTNKTIEIKDALSQLSIDATNGKIAEEQAALDLANAQGNETDALKHQAEIMKLNTEVTLKQKEIDSDHSDIIQKKNKAYKELLKSANEINKDYANATGNSLGYTEADIDLKYADKGKAVKTNWQAVNDQLWSLNNTEGSSQEEIDRYSQLLDTLTKAKNSLPQLISYEKQEAEIEDKITKLKMDTAEYDDEISDLDAKHSAGLIGIMEYEQRIYEINEEKNKVTSAGLQSELTMYKNMQNNGFNSPEILEKIREIKAQLIALSVDVSPYMKRLSDSFETNFSSGLTSMLTKAKGFREGLRSIFAGIYTDMVGYFSNQFSTYLKNQLFKTLTPTTFGNATSGSGNSASLTGFNKSLSEATNTVNKSKWTISDAGTELGEAFIKDKIWSGTKLATEQTTTTTLVTALTTLTTAALTASAALKTVSSSSSTGGSSSGIFSLFHWASGGAVTGAGTGTSDSIPAMLSNGEYVMRAAAVRKLGIKNLDALNYGNLPELKFASGGYVTSNAGTKTTVGNTLSSLSSLKIEVINNTSSDVQVTNTETSVDAEGTLIRLWMGAVSKNREGSADLLKLMK